MQLLLSSAVIYVSSETGELIAKIFEYFTLFSFKKAYFSLFPKEPQEMLNEKRILNLSALYYSKLTYYN
jgi:hypothetical protein